MRVVRRCRLSKQIHIHKQNTFLGLSSSSIQSKIRDWSMWRSDRALNWELRGTQFESGSLHCHISHHPQVVSFIYQLSLTWRVTPYCVT